MTRSRYIRLIMILGSLAALGPFSVDMYLPGFPTRAKDLQTDAASIGLSLASFFVDNQPCHWADSIAPGCPAGK
ncbi:MAG TPA: hypothetical protein VK666_07070 [Chryseolinea sp.]|nr:hypothetical protein [Chryseolinea sp.]